MTNFVIIGITVLLLFTSLCCHCQNQTTLTPLHRNTSSSEETSDDLPLSIKCTVLFNSMSEIEETFTRKYYISSLKITGRTVRFSDIPPSDHCGGKCLAIEILATEKIIIDRDYDSQGLDVSLALAAPLIIITGNEHKIVLKGNHCKKHEKQRAEMGINGLDGKPGQPGGNFYALTYKLLWSMDKPIEDINLDLLKMEDIRESEISTLIARDYYQYYLELNDTIPIYNRINPYSLKIYVNGGDGCNGQSGGHGRNGTNGTVFDLSKMTSNGDVDGYRIILRREVEPPHNETYLGKGISQVILGEKATSGGQGGNAGIGGQGGLAGKRIFIFLNDSDLCKSKEISKQTDYCKIGGFKGYDGRDGEVGEGGRAGIPGKDCFLSLYSNESQIELRNVKYFDHELSNVHEGKNGVVPAPSNSPKIKPKVCPVDGVVPLCDAHLSSKQQNWHFKMYYFHDLLGNYKQFLQIHASNTTLGKIQKNIYQRMINCTITFMASSC